MPTTWALRLVVLPPDAAFSKSGQSPAIDRATEIPQEAATSPASNRNRLIFLAADYDSVSHPRTTRRSHCWRGAASFADYKDNRIVLDN